MYGKLGVSTLAILTFTGGAPAQTPARPTPPDPLPFSFTAPLGPAVFAPAADPAAVPAPAAAPAPAPVPQVTISVPHTATPTWLPSITLVGHMHWPRRPPRPPAPAKSTPAPMPRASFGGALPTPQTPAKFFPTP